MFKAGDVVKKSNSSEFRGFPIPKENETGINTSSKQSIAEKQASKLREYSTTEF